MSCRIPASILALSLAACGSPAPAPVESPRGSSGAEAPRVVDRSGPAIVECEAALDLGVDLGRIAVLRDALVPALGEALLGPAAEVTGTDRATVTNRRVLEAWGLARSGVAELVLCAPDADVQARVAALEALAPIVPNSAGTEGDFARAEAAAVRGSTGWIAAHAVLPVSDVGAFVARLDTALDDRMTVAGYERAYLDRTTGLVLGVSRAGESLSFELLIDPMASVVDSTGDGFPARAEAALRSRGRPGTIGRTLDLEGADARFVESPAALVDTNELLGFGAVFRAVRGAAGELRGQLYAQGAFEATRARALVDAAGGRSYASVDAHLMARGRSTFRAIARTPAALPDEATFHPTSRLEVTRAGAYFAAPPTFLHAFPFPGGTRGAFDEMRRLSGAFGTWIGTPSWIVASLADVYDEGARFIDDETRARADAFFEDVVLATDGDGTHATLALVASGVDAKQALCSLVVSGERCVAQARVGRPFSPDGEHTMLLASVSGRSIAIVAHDAAAARRVAARASVAAGTSPVRALISDAMMRDSEIAELVVGLCGSARLAMERDGDALVLTVDRESCVAP